MFVSSFRDANRLICEPPSRGQPPLNNTGGRLHGRTVTPCLCRVCLLCFAFKVRAHSRGVCSFNGVEVAETGQMMQGKGENK